MAELRGKAVIVTGGTRGIGRAIATALLEHGADLAIAARTSEDVRQAVAELAETVPDSRRITGIACDVGKYDDCRRLVTEAVRTLGRLDVLVNNAGIGSFAPVAEMPVEVWEQVIRTNLDSLFFCCREAIPHLREAGGGWIINIGSLAGKNAFPGGGAYNASKFGLIGFSEALMQELRYDGIRVSYIMPGSVASDFRGTREDSQADWKIQPEDIAEIVLGLLRSPARTLPSRVEVRPSMPPRR